MDKHTLKNMICVNCPECSVEDHTCMAADKPRKIKSLNKRPEWCPLKEND